MFLLHGLVVAAPVLSADTAAIDLSVQNALVMIGLFGAPVRLRFRLLVTRRGKEQSRGSQSGRGRRAVRRAGGAVGARRASGLRWEPTPADNIPDEIYTH